ncbi:ribosome assembly RNA-binding protein YhbY [Desulfobulbus sp. F4]|nr:ribosome assembly RNA-binding protein YhbY [Desulfobulbus sp. F3]MCW5200531.1 ribosome assembly RNA-binding protein YhbY [Desulfobulbus sp. F4]
MKSETAEKSKITLQGKQKRFLRSLGHHLDPVVQLGKEGLSDNLTKAALDALKTRELIKVKLGQNCAVSAEEAAAALSGQTGAAVVQLIGRTILLYLPNKKLKPEQRIRLPKADTEE